MPRPASWSRSPVDKRLELLPRRGCSLADDRPAVAEDGRTANRARGIVHAVRHTTSMPSRPTAQTPDALLVAVARYRNNSRAEREVRPAATPPRSARTCRTRSKESDRTFASG